MDEGDPLFHAILVAAVLLAVVLRIRRIGRMQRLRLGTLWVVPAIILGLAAMIFWQFPPVGLDWLWIGTGFAAGGAMGWWRGRFVAISLDPATGHMMQRSSPGALLFLGLLFAVRWALRWAVLWGDQRWHFGAMLISDIFIAIAAGVLTLYRIELYFRARKLLRSA